MAGPPFSLSAVVVIDAVVGGAGAGTTVVVVPGLTLLPFWWAEAGTAPLPLPLWCCWWWGGEGDEWVVGLK